MPFGEFYLTITRLVSKTLAIYKAYTAQYVQPHCPINGLHYKA